MNRLPDPSLPDTSPHKAGVSTDPALAMRRAGTTGPAGRARRALATVVALALTGVAVLVPSAPAAAASWSLSGSINFSDDDLALTESPNNHLVVKAFAADATVYVSSEHLTTQASASFWLPNLPAGKDVHLRLEESRGSTAFVQGWVTASGTVSTSRAQAASFNASSGSVIIKPALGPVVTGQLIAPEGHSIDFSGTSVRLTSSSNWVRATAEGRFAAPAPDGPSTLFVRAEDPPTILSGYYGPGGTLVTTGDNALTVTPGKPVTIYPTLAASISGTVALADGTAPNRVRVEVYSASGTSWTYADSVSVSADGTFLIDKLRSGQPYRLAAGPQSTSNLEPSAWVSNTEVAAVLDLGSDVVAPATGLRVTLREKGAVSGTVAFPATFAYSSATPPTVTGTYPNYSILDGAERTSDPVDVGSDGSFTLPTTHSTMPVTVTLTWPNGKKEYWAGNTTLPAPDRSTARDAYSPQRIIFPLANHSVTPPVLGGQAVVDGTLTASAGTWSSTPANVNYQWLRNGAPLSGATGSTYTPRASDVGATFSVRVTASGTNLVDAAATSASSRIAAGTLRATAVPRLTGTTAVGGTLTASAGTWSAPPTAVTYQWLRNGAVIANATRATYRLVPADAKARITVAVTATRAGYTAARTQSAAVTIAPAMLRTTTKPTLSAKKATAGVTLRARPGSWSTKTSHTYRWLRNGKAIKGATKPTYRPTKNDIGRALSVRITTRAAGHVTATTTLKTRGKVAKFRPTITVKAPTRVKRTTRPTATIWVKATRLTKRPTGTLTVTYGTKKTKISLTYKRKGKVKVTLPRQAKGKRALTVKYTPAKKWKRYVSSATSKKRTITVR